MQLDHKQQNLPPACKLQFFVEYAYNMYKSWWKSRKAAS